MESVLLSMLVSYDLEPIANMSPVHSYRVHRQKNPVEKKHYDVIIVTILNLILKQKLNFEEYFENALTCVTNSNSYLKYENEYQ